LQSKENYTKKLVQGRIKKMKEKSKILDSLMQDEVVVKRARSPDIVG
jgi:hypothetical protein